MAELYQRCWRLTVGDSAGKNALQTTDLALQFNARRNLKSEPNKATITVVNLSPDSRKALEQPKRLYCVLEVGYAGDLFVIFQGELRAGTSTKSDGTWMTKLEGFDGADAPGARVKVSLPAKAGAGDVIGTVTKSLKTGLGNVRQQIAAGVSPLTAVATVLQGASSEAMDQMTRGAGAEWSIQNGAVQLLGQGKTLPGRSVLLSSMNGNTGLVGSPTVDGKGVMTCKALIVPGLDPGRSIVLDTMSLKGAYRIQEVEYSGDTHGAEWYATIHARAFETAA